MELELRNGVFLKGGENDRRETEEAIESNNNPSPLLPTRTPSIWRGAKSNVSQTVWSGCLNNYAILFVFVTLLTLSPPESIGTVFNWVS